MSAIKYDRLVVITTGANRKTGTWLRTEIMLSALWERLETPVRSTETQAEYKSLKKAQQDELKDVGGFVGGEFTGTHRKASEIKGRDIVTLDLDNLPEKATELIVLQAKMLGCGYCIYSTRKHTPEAPRLRLLIPLDRSVSTDEYGAISRKLADTIGMAYMDGTTFDVARLMYWPSVSADGEYIYRTDDKPLLSADAILAEYTDWHDISQWPRPKGETIGDPARLTAKAEDPETKTGLVGAFCRCYNIYRAIDELIPGVYTPVERMEDRYTYAKGSTTGGAIVYGGGKWLYSHHDTDPCANKLLNSFDLVRLHRFGELDDSAKDGTPINRMPSYTAMTAYIDSDLPEVGLKLLQDRREEALKEFDGVAPLEPVNDNWMLQLERNTYGLPKSTIENAKLVLSHDVQLAGKIVLNTFIQRIEVRDSLPWAPKPEVRAWSDTDDCGLAWYLEKVYSITGRDKIVSALTLYAADNPFDNVCHYLEQLSWDGVKRLDTLLIDYLGAEDDEYTRAVTRKAFVAAVARAMDPGVKFDNMLIISGPQGIGKSSLLSTMSRGWFNDSISTFEGKEASELLRGVWLVEISELDAFRGTDVSRIKQFLSLQVDRYRAAYGRTVSELPRRCVFFGTTNSTEFLRDQTGNRRFWPVDAKAKNPVKNVWRDLPAELDQIWAEAMAYWQTGEPLFLPPELEEASQVIQELHREAAAQEGVILDFVERSVPQDWASWSLDQRRMFWARQEKGTEVLVPREKVCALEIWCEAFGGSPRDRIPAYIATTMNASAKWKRSPHPLRFGYCGHIRGWIRK